MRKRSANFTRKEVAVLMFLVKKYRTQVDCKLMGTNPNKMKGETWNEIAQEFNRLCGSVVDPRTPFVLRNKYKNMKRDRLVARIKKNLDRGEQSERDDPVKDSLKLHTEYEANSDVLQLKEESCFDETMDTEISLVASLNETHSEEGVPIQDPTKIDITKEDLLALQKRCFLEEHALKLQHMQEIHDRTLRIQESEAEEKLKQMREEHKLQLEILQLRKQCLLKL